MSQIDIDVETLITKENQDFFNQKSILITGASGLLGSYFVTFFQKLDSYKNGNTQLYVSSLSGVFTVPIHRKTFVIDGDLSNLELIGTLPRFDLIIHASGYAQPGKFLENRTKTMELNSVVTQKLTEKLNNSGRFLFVSTSEIYSGLSNPPFRENQVGTTNTDHERAPYIEGKRYGEAIVANLKYSDRDLVGFSARLALAYGPGIKNSDSRVLYDFIKTALESKEIVLKDSGSAMRTYCYVLDAIAMMLAIVKKGTQPIYNVGGVSRLSIAELAEKVAKITNSKLHVPFSSQRFLSSAPSDVWLDLSSVSTISPTNNLIEIDDGLLRTITWLQAQQ
jgi:nucleoside-diphosphate-sugar epimerase